MPKLCKHISCTQFVFSKGYCKSHQYLREDKKANEKNIAKGELDLPTLLEIAQKIHNTYIRLRDQNKGCISCINGKVEQAGHYYPVGTCSILRFNERNTNGQCAKCNCGEYGNIESYKEGMKKRYSEDELDELLIKANVLRFYKWSREELNEIIADRKAKIKELQKVKA